MQQYPRLESKDLQEEVCRILDKLKLSYEKERYSAHNSSIIGKRRRVDVVVLSAAGQVIMHIECKNQNSAGSAEDKLFKAVEEANRDKRLGTPSIIVVGGFGWSEADIRHAMLNGAVRIEMLEDWLTLYMRYEKENPACIVQGEPTVFQPCFLDSND